MAARCEALPAAVAGSLCVAVGGGEGAPSATLALLTGAVARAAPNVGGASTRGRRGARTRARCAALVLAATAPAAATAAMRRAGADVSKGGWCAVVDAFTDPQREDERWDLQGDDEGLPVRDAGRAQPVVFRNDSRCGCVLTQLRECILDALGARGSAGANADADADADADANANAGEEAPLVVIDDVGMLEVIAAEADPRAGRRAVALRVAHLVRDLRAEGCALVVGAASPRAHGGSSCRGGGGEGGTPLLALLSEAADVTMRVAALGEGAGAAAGAAGVAAAVDVCYKTALVPVRAGGASTERLPFALRSTGAAFVSAANALSL